MPDFLGEFSSSIGSKREVLKTKMLKGTPNLLVECFEKHFKAHWVELDDVARYSAKPSSLGITAVDSSRYTNLMSTGGIFYVIRSLAACRNSERKLLETDVFFTKAGLLEAERFVGTKMELLEFQVAIDALESGFECGCLLIDGSLYGRISHLPIETPVEDQRLMLLHYFETYRRFLDLCKKKGILLIGVSKESRSTFYRDYLLKLIFDETFEGLGGDVDPLDLQKLKPLFSEALGNEKSALAKFAALEQKYGKKFGVLRLVFDELGCSRPDYQLIMNLAGSKGYTTPLLLGPSVRMALRFEQCWRDPVKYVRTYFPVTYRQKGKEFVKWASDILAGLTAFPGIVSMYVLLDKRDSPIRLDFPCWDYSFSRTGWPKPVDVSLDEVLKVMATGYCGLDCYNLWLKNVDERVRLKKRTVDTIYFPLMERLFDAKIIRGRGYRRVKYP